MKKFHQLCAVVVLTLTLALPAFAGEMGCPGVTSPPPDQQQNSATGEIQLLSASVTGQMDIPLVAETALTLMVNVLSVF
jgi:hypothetical protein